MNTLYSGIEIVKSLFSRILHKNFHTINLFSLLFQFSTFESEGVAVAEGNDGVDGRVGAELLVKL